MERIADLFQFYRDEFLEAYQLMYDTAEDSYTLDDTTMLSEIFYVFGCLAHCIEIGQDSDGGKQIRVIDSMFSRAQEYLKEATCSCYGATLNMMDDRFSDIEDVAKTIDINYLIKMPPDDFKKSIKDFRKHLRSINTYNQDMGIARYKEVADLGSAISGSIAKENLQKYLDEEQTKEEQTKEEQTIDEEQNNKIQFIEKQLKELLYSASKYRAENKIVDAIIAITVIVIASIAIYIIASYTGWSLN